MDPFQPIDPSRTPELHLTPEGEDRLAYWKRQNELDTFLQTFRMPTLEEKQAMAQRKPLKVQRIQEISDDPANEWTMERILGLDSPGTRPSDLQL